jgi:hypothetical protein
MDEGSPKVTPTVTPTAAPSQPAANGLMDHDSASLVGKIQKRVTDLVLRCVDREVTQIKKVWNQPQETTPSDASLPSDARQYPNETPLYSGHEPPVHHMPGHEPPAHHMPGHEPPVHQLGQPLFHQNVVGNMEPTDRDTPTRDTTSYLPEEGFTNAPVSSTACNVASQSSLPGHRMSIPQQLQATVPPPASMQQLLYRHVPPPQVPPPQVPQAYMQHILHREVPPPQVPPGYMQHPQTRLAPTSRTNPPRAISVTPAVTMCQ